MMVNHFCPMTFELSSSLTKLYSIKIYASVFPPACLNVPSIFSSKFYFEKKNNNNNNNNQDPMHNSSG